MTAPDPQTVRGIARANAAAVAAQLRAERARQELKQSELGLGTSVLCSWETGRSAPGLHNLTRWAATLGLEIIARRPDEQPQDVPCPRCRYGTEQHRATCERAADEQPQDERDAALAELTAELESANANAAEIAKERGKYREEIMRLRVRVRELEGAQPERDGGVRAVDGPCGNVTSNVFGDRELTCARQPHPGDDWHHDRNGARWRWLPVADVHEGTMPVDIAALDARDAKGGDA